MFVDDIMIKSKKLSNFPKDLEKTLKTLQYYGLKLNPSKCSFTVRSGKFLGYQLTPHGLGVNPDNVKAITKMRSPQTHKEVQKLTWCLAVLNRFLSRAADRQLSFFA